MTKEASWLFTDVPVYKEGEGKKARWYVELKDDVTVEVKPISGFKLWVLHRTYLSQVPDPPIVEMELEGVAAVQRTRDYQDENYRREVAKVFLELDAQLTQELLHGVILPADDAWAMDWIGMGRPMPQNRTLKVDLYLVSLGIEAYEDRTMLIRAIDAISQETPNAIERAQDFFRDYMGRNEVDAAEDAGLELADDAEGRDSLGDASLPPDGEAVVQAAPGGTGDDAGPAAQPEHEGVPKQSRRQGSKRRKAG